MNCPKCLLEIDPGCVKCAYDKGYAKCVEDMVTRMVGDAIEKAVNESQGKFSDLRKWALAVDLAICKIQEVRAVGGNGRLEKIEVKENGDLDVKLTIRPEPVAEHIEFSLSVDKDLKEGK